MPLIVPSHKISYNLGNFYIGKYQLRHLITDSLYPISNCDFQK